MGEGGGEGEDNSQEIIMAHACTPQWRFACLRVAASVKVGHAGVGDTPS